MLAVSPMPNPCGFRIATNVPLTHASTPGMLPSSANAAFASSLAATVSAESVITADCAMPICSSRPTLLWKLPVAENRSAHTFLAVERPLARLHCSSAPRVFMTDNSSAEKAALGHTWPSARQLLCHFHVAQAEWRWLTAAKNNVHKDQRRGFMDAFQQASLLNSICSSKLSVMYAETVEEVEASTAALKALPHKAFVERVEAFLQKKEEWVTFFRSATATRGHNINNFAEATIRVLKDIILNRVEAFNVVALVDAVAVVWEKYFQTRVLRHAHGRVAAHHVAYERLLSRLPAGAADRIKAVGNNRFLIPSASRSDLSYEVLADIGWCSCGAGQQGAFCKHQALIHKQYGGLFPNAHALCANDKFQLGKLALGDKCPPRQFFEGFSGEEKLPGGASNGIEPRSPQASQLAAGLKECQISSHQCWMRIQLLDQHHDQLSNSLMKSSLPR
ncbi:hypothetical protein HPB50_002086 [Hyalomma asiaticum]|uniref:Uncharacterized protein n=1 Tax=Hyalomma asiaticum TaxID=266040 RepID=A0ACB7TB39_HYAAI|nr:hypothetical protein HPB50_002086 [Hyalomma asiaticum]